MEKDFTSPCPGMGGGQVRKGNRTSETKATLWAQARRCDGCQTVCVCRTGSPRCPSGGVDGVGWRAGRSGDATGRRCFGSRCSGSRRVSKGGPQASAFSPDHFRRRPHGAAGGWLIRCARGEAPWECGISRNLGRWHEGLKPRERNPLSTERAGVTCTQAHSGATRYVIDGVFFSLELS